MKQPILKVGRVLGRINRCNLSRKKNLGILINNFKNSDNFKHNNSFLEI